MKPIFMQASTIEIEKTMLYCPKCNATYEDGSQRFCLNDGGRLLPAPSSIKAAATSQGVFASILRSSPENESAGKSAPRVFVAEPLKDEQNTFHSNLSSKVFKTEENPSENSNPPQVSDPKEKFQVLKPVGKVINQSEVHSGTADTGDRKVDPLGRSALTWENPEILINQTIKGRYLITDVLDQDDSSITYLAEDKIIADKEMIVRVLMEEESDDFLSRIFAEERVSLSHINHPNVASVLDSGELLEGNPFIVTEMVDGFSVGEKLEVVGKFDPIRAAKIVRQTSYALSELHQNGVLHRNLRPDNIFLTIVDNKEQVKVTDFAVSGYSGHYDVEGVKYMSPEQLEGRLPNYAGDIYSLAVIAYEMLTGQYPFQFSSVDGLLKAQKKSLTLKISEQPFNLPVAANDVLEKALSYEPSGRYPKARDFGDALFQSLTVSPVVELKETKDAKTSKEVNAIPMPPGFLFPPQTDESFVARESQAKQDRFLIQKNEPEEVEKESTIKDSADLAWEKRSPDPLNEGNNSWLWMAGVGILVVLLASWIVWHYALNRQQTPQQVAVSNATGDVQNAQSADENTAEKSSPTPQEVESPPLPRIVDQPANTEYFQNSSMNLKGDLARNYRGFTLYYPKGWQKNATPTNFIDVSKSAESGTPIEQFLVSYYDSRGTSKLDVDRFPKLVQDSNKKLAQIVSNYRLVSEGNTEINNGWKGYEMKFEGAGTTASGEKINLWGKRLFIPAARPGTKSGFVITMLATSLSPDVKSVDDVGVKGETARILETFEPSTLD